MFLSAKRALTGTARHWLESQRGLLSWKAIRESLEEAFGKQITVSDIHDLMRSRKKKKDESILAYVQELEFYGAHGNVPAYEVRRYIVRGFTDDTKVRMLLMGAASRSHLIDMLQTHEIENASKSDRKNNQKHRGRYNNDDRVCFVCRESGHKAKDCKKDGRECYNCKEKGHISRNCPKNNRSSKTTPAPVVNKVNHVLAGINSSRFIANVGGMEIECQMDSGADKNILREDIFNKIKEKHQQYELDGGKLLLECSGGPISTLGGVKIPTIIKGTEYNIHYLVVPESKLPSPVLIGDQLLDVAVVKLSRDGPEIEPIIGCGYILQIQAEAEDIFAQLTAHISQPYREKVLRMLTNYSPKRQVIAPVEMKIVLNDPTPVASHPRRLSPGDEAIMREILDTWLEDGVIVKSDAEWASQVLTKTKKNGKKRVCIDYIKTNKKVKKQHHPTLVLEDALDVTDGSVVSTTLDLKDEFFHVLVEKESRKILSFVVPWGQYEPTVAPFGFCNSTVVFQEFVAKIFGDLVSDKIFVIYVDDIFIKASDKQEPMERLEIVLGIAEKHGLRFSWKKYQIMQKRVEYIG